MGSADRPLTIVCLACYFKGVEFIRECKRQGARVYLVTSRHLEHEDWPRDSIDEIYYMEEKGDQWNIPMLIKSVSFIARHQMIDRIVALDDFDLEKAAALREHLRVAGLGDTRTRFFRDKLSMRMRASELGLAIPEFVHVLNHQKIHEYSQSVPGPWIIKPRSQASAVGMTKIHSVEQLWEIVNKLGDQQSAYLLERFVPGDIFHVDSIVFERKVVFARVHKYESPPMSVAHEGGIFCSHNIKFGSPNEKALLKMNRELLRGLGLLSGVSHSEFIRAHEDGKFYFLETSARAGGAHIPEMVEAASGINLWREWARIETLKPGEAYTVPPATKSYAGIVLSLARQEWPDTSAYSDAEITWRLNKRHHAGLIATSPKLERLRELLDDYMRRFGEDFLAVQPLPDRPSA